ncbi:MAG: radical SAM protein [Planctomycetota bacterium]|nr:radical SAM protein [Planctomycetota bacterium]
MRVLALNPPYLPNYSRTQRSPQVTKSGTFYYPIWLAYAAGWVEAGGHEMRLIDAPADGLSREQVFARVDEFQPDLVMIETSTPSIESDAEVGRLLKERRPEAIVGLVGPHVSATPTETLESYPWIDFCTLEEYDETCRQIADSLESGDRQAWKKVHGIAHREADGVVLNPKQEWIQDLDQQPFVSSVYKKNLDYKKYFYAITQWPVVTVISGRGCPYKCDYCMFPQTLTGRQYRTRSPANVADEFEYIEKEFPDVREIFVEDDTLTLHRRRTVELCEEIIGRGLKIHWTCNARADVDLETLKMMRAANCRLLCVGVESGDQDILDNVGKGIQLPQIHQFFKDSRKAGLMVHGCFMAGNRGETRETMEKTLELAKELKPDTAQFYPLMIYPGTRAYEWALEENLIEAESYKEWLTPEGLHSTVVNRPDLPHEEVVRFCDRARREFYLRPGYVAYKLLQVVKRPREFGRLVKSFKTFARYLFRK